MLASFIAPSPPWFAFLFPSWMLGIPCIALVIYGISVVWRVALGLCLSYHAFPLNIGLRRLDFQGLGFWFVPSCASSFSNFLSFATRVGLSLCAHLRFRPVFKRLIWREVLFSIWLCLISGHPWSYRLARAIIHSQSSLLACIACTLGFGSLPCRGL